MVINKTCVFVFGFYQMILQEVNKQHPDKQTGVFQEAQRRRLVLIYLEACANEDP